MSMPLLLALDSGPLGQLAHPDKSRNPDLHRWFANQIQAGAIFLIPEITDFEVRRNLILESRAQSLLNLDILAKTAVYLPITTDDMRLAAHYWARARKTGKSVGDPKELNADVTDAAQAFANEAVVVTDNIGHLAQFVEARPWSTIKP